LTFNPSGCNLSQQIFDPFRLQSVVLAPLAGIDQLVMVFPRVVVKRGSDSGNLNSGQDILFVDVGNMCGHQF